MIWSACSWLAAVTKPEEGAAAAARRGTPRAEIRWREGEEASSGAHYPRSKEP